MLINGKFVKEEPPKIGVFYLPQYRVPRTTPEEKWVQDIHLGHRMEKNSFLSKIFGLMLRI
jgi:hypothetical protein